MKVQEQLQRSINAAMLICTPRLIGAEDADRHR